MDERLTSVNESLDIVSFKMKLAEEYTNEQNYDSAAIELEAILSIEPKYIEANYLLGQIYEFQEKYTKAAECYSIIMEFEPNDEFKLKAANVYEQVDMYKEAMDIYLEQHEKNKENNDIIDKLAHVSMLMNDTNSAIYYYQMLYERNADDEVAVAQLMELYENTDKFMHYKFKGLIAKREGRLSHATGCYKRALDFNGEDTNLRYELAELYLKENSKELAIEELSKIIEINNTHLVALKKLAEIHLSMDNTQEALNTYEQIVKINTGDIVALNNLAEIYLEIDENQKAVEILTKSISINSRDIRSRILISKAFLAQKNQLMAYTNIQKAKLIAPENIEVLSLFTDYYISEGNFKKAVEVCENIVSLIPSSPFGYRKMAEISEYGGDLLKTHYNYGIYHKLKGERQLAIDELSWAHEIEPTNKEIISILAKLHEENEEEYVACDYYEKLYKLDNSDISSLKKMGELFVSKGDYIRAQDIFDEILNINESDFDAKLGIATIAEKQKNYTLALEHYKHYIDNAPLSPKFPELRQKITILEEKINSQNDDGILGKFLKIFSR